MPQSTAEFWETILALLPLSICGALGAFFRYIKHGRSVAWCFVEAAGGFTVATIAGPIVMERVPPDLIWGASFLIGWGGLLLVEITYRIMSRVVFKKVQKHLDVEEKSE